MVTSSARKPTITVGNGRSPDGFDLGEDAVGLSALLDTDAQMQRPLVGSGGVGGHETAFVDIHADDSVRRIRGTALRRIGAFTGIARVHGALWAAILGR